MTARTGDGAIRVGLIGHGDAGALIHGPLIEAAGGYRIVGVSTLRPQALSMRRDKPRWERDPEFLIASDDVDLVVVATPNHTHHRYARAALMAGKAVVVEKPFVTRPDQARDLIALSRARGLILTVFQNRRFDGDFLRLREVIASGALGALTRFEARWDRRPGETLQGWRTRDEEGGGIHWDLGAHLVDQVLQLFGQPLFRAGRVFRPETPSQAVTAFELMLRYSQGLECLVSAGHEGDRLRPRFRVTGVGGSLTITAQEIYDPAIRRGRHPSDPDFWSGAALPQAELIIDGVRSAVPIEPPRWDIFYPRLAASFRDQTPLEVTADQAARVVELIHALDDGAGQVTPYLGPDTRSPKDNEPCQTAI